MTTTGRSVSWAATAPEASIKAISVFMGTLPVCQGRCPNDQTGASGHIGQMTDTALDGVEELGVRAELVDGLEQSLHRLDRLQREQRAAELLHLLVLVLAEELLFFASA